MDLIWQFEIQITLWLQSIGEGLSDIMNFFSFLGTENFYLIVLPVLYWCVDSAIGARIGMMLLLSNWLNGLFKLIFHTPRPYWIDERVAAYSAETGFGMPSGHSMSAASLWGLMARLFKHRWFTVAAVVVIFLIGLSRIYLGMHFLSDVLVGWLLGALLLLAYIRLEKPVLDWIKKKNVEQQLSVILTSSLFILILGLGVLYLLRNWALPIEWVASANLKTPDHPIDPFSLDGMITIAGLWLGMLGGLAWFVNRYGMFNAGGPPWKRFVRYLLGLAGILVFWYGLGQVFPENPDLLSYCLRYLRYTLVGAWVTALAPWMFIRLRLASKYEK